MVKMKEVFQKTNKKSLQLIDKMKIPMKKFKEVSEIIE
jgi:hypothetical protein